MPLVRAFVVVLVLVLAAFPARAAQKESAYDRVMRTGTIRCGYAVAKPYLFTDLKTGKLTGIWHDYMESLAQELGLEIDWTGEVGLGDFVTALETHRIDAMCIGIWVDPARARAVDFVTPISYHTVYAYARPDDRRFDKNYAAINDPGVTLTFIDGDVAADIAKKLFPKAKTLTLPQMSPPSDALLNVANGKADVTIWSPEIVSAFNESSGKKLRRIENAHPLRVFAESVAVGRGEYDFVRMLDHTTRFMIDNGTIDSILRKYESAHSSFRRTVRPYEDTP